MPPQPLPTRLAHGKRPVPGLDPTGWKPAYAKEWLGWRGERLLPRKSELDLSVATPCGSRLVREHKLPGGRTTLAEVVSLPLDGDGPGAARLLLSHVAPSGNRYQPDAPAAVDTFGIAGDFEFLDIGDGMPDSTFAPTADWNGQD